MVADRKLEEKAQKEEPVFRAEFFRKNRGLAFGLATVFAIIYFGAALVTSVPFKEVAALNVLGLSLGVWMGWLVLLGGLVIVQIYLFHGVKK